MSLIKKEDLIERVERYIIGCPIYSDKTKSFVKEILEAEIKYFPAIDPVKHARWERYHEIKQGLSGTGGTDSVVEYEVELVMCSECTEIVEYESNFCPYCGAKMESVKNDIN